MHGHITSTMEITVTAPNLAPNQLDGARALPHSEPISASGADWTEALITQLLAKSAEPAVILGITNALAWAKSLERQICLDTVRDAAKGSEIEALSARLSPAPGESSCNGFLTFDEIADKFMQRACAGSPDVSKALAANQWRPAILSMLKHETLSELSQLRSAGRDTYIAEAALRADPIKLFETASGDLIEACIDTKEWRMWYPGLDHDRRTLGEVLETLPGLLASDVPEAISDLENPSSPNALPGAVTLERHDVLHVLLGRGLMDQDEAFVIGFTMGNSSEYRPAHGETLKAAFCDQYPEPFRIYGEKLAAFDLGVEAGKITGIRDIALLPIEEMTEVSIRDLRDELKISVEVLRSFYRKEQSLIGTTFESGRLPVRC